MAQSFREPPARRCGWRPSPGPYRSHPLPDGARGGERPGSKLIPASHPRPYPLPIRAPKRDHDEWLVRGGWAGRGSLRSGQSRGRSYSRGQKPCGSAVNDAGGACPLRPKCLAAAWRRQGQEPLNPLWYKPKTPAAGRGSGPTSICGLPLRDWSFAEPQGGSEIAGTIRVAPEAPSCLLQAGAPALWGLSSQVLNLNSITSPSLTTYSLPSSRALPASLAGTSPPRLT